MPVEPEAQRQLEHAARLPIVFRHIAAMPDVHVGIGATVGAAIPTLRAIIPAAVGVDIGCGMIASKTTLRAEDLPDNPARMLARSAVLRACVKETMDCTGKSNPVRAEPLGTHGIPAPRAWAHT